MTALRIIVGVCDKYVKVLKKKLVGKWDEKRRRRRRQDYAVKPRNDDYYYDNEAVDNMINEFIDNKRTATEAACR